MAVNKLKDEIKDILKASARKVEESYLKVNSKYLCI